MSTPDRPDNPLEHPYIYTPKSRLPRTTRTVHGVLTLAAWAVYAYLWLPLITVVAWVLGIRTSYVELYVRNNHLDQSIFLVLLVLAVAATALLVGWAEYNRHKFGGPDRRTSPRDVEAHDIAHSFGAPIELSHHLTRAKSMRLAMAEDGRLTGIHGEPPLTGTP